MRGIYYKNEAIEVQKKGKNAWNRTVWISLGTFDSEDEALLILEDEAEIMHIIELVRGVLK